jgi:predicted dehydrogenase
MYRVKIYGAGSIGNHLAHACRSLGWQVVVCDVSNAALERMEKDIYPVRYGKWDESIQLYNNEVAPIGGFDLILIGTPPDLHLPLALQSLSEHPRAILIEKPACKPDLEFAAEFYQNVCNSQTKVFVGYDHVVGRATHKTEELIRSGSIGQVCTLDVEFREHWAGIFKAHSWLEGPQDTYLGFTERGGGASGEHSHATNLWQHFAHAVGCGRITEVSATLQSVAEGRAFYDNLCLLNVKTESGLIGRIVQDVVSLPPRKRARIQGTQGAIEWVNGYNNQGDAVIVQLPGQEEEVHLISKKRPDDFIDELKHIETQIDTAQFSGISLERGLDTILVVAAAHKSNREKRTVKINFGVGYTLEALQ